MGDEPSSVPRSLPLGLHRHKPKGHRHRAVLFEVVADGGNRGAGEEAAVDASSFLNSIKSCKELFIKPKGKGFSLTHVHIVMQNMKKSNKSLARTSAMYNIANMLTAKATPELVQRAKRAAKRSSLNVSSLVRHGVMRVCSEIERDGFLTIRAQEPEATYSVNATKAPASDSPPQRRVSRKSARKEGQP